MTLAEQRTNIVILTLRHQRRDPRRTRPRPLPGRQGAGLGFVAATVLLAVLAVVLTRSPRAARSRSEQRRLHRACSPRYALAITTGVSAPPSRRRAVRRLSHSSPRRSRPPACSRRRALMRRRRITHNNRKEHRHEHPRDLTPAPARADGARRPRQRPRRARVLRRHATAHGDHGTRATIALVDRAVGKSSLYARTCASSGRTTSPGRGWRSSASTTGTPDTEATVAPAAEEPDRHRQRRSSPSTARRPATS